MTQRFEKAYNSLVVMLPTNEKASKLSVLNSGKLNYGAEAMTSTNTKLQHLYILSDKEIKEGDWIFNSEREPSIVQCIGKGSLRGWKKIIATTDLNLSAIPEGDTFAKLIPEIPQSFIEKFVEEYNRGNVITEVMVEYIDNGEEDWIGDDYTGEPFWNEKIELKINPKDNTINITIV